MEEKSTYADIIDRKTKLSIYDDERENNFRMCNEIMVTVTLNEYRSLVIDNTILKQKQIRDSLDKDDLRNEVKKYMNENALLRMKLGIGPNDVIEEE